MASQHPAGAPSVNLFLLPAHPYLGDTLGAAVAPPLWQKCLPSERPPAQQGHGECFQQCSRSWENVPWADWARTCCSLCTDSALHLCHAKDLELLLWSPTGACLGLQPQAGQSQELLSPQFLLLWEGRVQHPRTGGTSPGQWSPVGSFSHKSGREQEVLLPLDSTGTGLGLCPARIHGASVHWGVGTSPLSLISNNSCLSLGS